MSRDRSADKGDVVPEARSDRLITLLSDTELACAWSRIPNGKTGNEVKGTSLSFAQEMAQYIFLGARSSYA
jgi:hypothetical protein